jgi:hypothetical protein
VVCFYIAIIRFTGGDKMKTMVWIDDSISQLARISDSLFYILWKHDVRNEMILVGDNYKEEEPDADRNDFVNLLRDNIADLFYQFCYEQKGNKSLDKYYDDKDEKGIVPGNPENLPDGASYDEVVKIIDDFIKKSKGDDIVVGIDVRLNIKKSGTEKTLTDKILDELPGKPGIKKIFAYSNYQFEEHQDIEAFKKEHAGIDVFREQNLEIKGSDEQIKFFGFFNVDIKAQENGDLTK